VATLPFAFVLIGYAVAGGLDGAYGASFTQGARNDLGFALHVVEPAHLDRWLFGELPTTWLQDRLYAAGRVHWYDAVVALVYVTHFVVSPVVAIVLWFRDRDRFRAWVRCVLALAALGLATYIAYPMAPPWLAADDGVIEPVSRISGLGWEVLHLEWLGGLVELGQATSNPVAAMPSLHVGFAALCAAFFAGRGPWWRTPALAGYPLAMGFAVVYAGEHYVVDVFVGVAYAVCVVLAWRVLAMLSQRGRTHSGPPERFAALEQGPSVQQGPSVEQGPSVQQGVEQGVEQLVR